MGQNHFRFKQFSVRQDLDVMRVNQDGVLLGAWAAIEGASRALDVGTGTGVIALMLAQRGVARVDAIDITPESARQAQANFTHSPWAERLRMEEAPFQLWAETCEQDYDLVVSNPPYFTSSLRSPYPSRNAMRHADLLPAEDLIAGLELCLATGGRFAGIFPLAEGARFVTQAAGVGLHCRRSLLVSHRPNTPPKRMLCELSRTPGPLHEDRISVFGPDGQTHTPAYVALTHEFYLYL